MALTNIQITKAKPADKEYHLSDGGGLSLLIRPTGTRTWVFRYRHPVTGKPDKLIFGQFPHWSLKDARDERERCRELIQKGTDPKTQAKVEKIKAQADLKNTFGVYAEQWFDLMRKTKWGESTYTKRLSIYTNHLEPYLKDRPVSELTTPELKIVSDRIINTNGSGGEKGDRFETAKRATQYMVHIIDEAVLEGACEYNPALPLSKKIPTAETNHRAAEVDPRKLGKMLRAFDDYEGGIIVKTALRIAPLLFQRPGEVVSMEWAHLDLKKGLWNIPKENKKERRQDHFVPLSRQAVKMLKELKLVTGRNRYVFTNSKDVNRHIPTDSVSKAIRTCGYSTSDDQSFHGFRATARTITDEQMKERVDYVEHQLAHAVKDPNGRAYNRTKFLDDRVGLMQRWSDYLDSLKESCK